jgi:hypothetical protein
LAVSFARREDTLRGGECEKGLDKVVWREGGGWGGGVLSGWRRTHMRKELLDEC